MSTMDVEELVVVHGCYRFKFIFHSIVVGYIVDVERYELCPGHMLREPLEDEKKKLVEAICEIVDKFNLMEKHACYTVRHREGWTFVVEPA